MRKSILKKLRFFAPDCIKDFYKKKFKPQLMTRTFRTLTSLLLIEYPVQIREL